MAKKQVTGLSAAMLGVGQAEPTSPPIATATVVAAPAASRSDQIALTLKVPPAIYERLKGLGARRRLRNQAILLAALSEYLDREESR